jgi:hypothetical protein
VEQLLNAVWLVSVLGAFLAYLWHQPRLKAAQSAQAKALIALACVLFLLFPAISISDDLHPVSAALEDPTKRIVKTSRDLPQVRGDHPGVPLLAVVPVVLPVANFAVLRTTLHTATAAHLTNRERVPSDGRSPPYV